MWDGALAAVRAIATGELVRQFIAELTSVRQEARPRCGNCAHWMKRGPCPRERGIGSTAGGPSINGFACHSYEACEVLAAIYERRKQEIQARIRSLTERP